MQLSIFRKKSLIGLIDTGKILDFSRQRTPIEPFRIARDALFDRRIDENLENSLVSNSSRTIRRSAEGRNKRAQHDKTGIGHQLGDLADAPDIFHTVGFGKSKVPVQPVTHIVAIQHDRVNAAGVKSGFHKVGDSRFARPGKPGKPQHRRAVMHELRPVRLTDC